MDIYIYMRQHPPPPPWYPPPPMEWYDPPSPPCDSLVGATCRGSALCWFAVFMLVGHHMQGLSFMLVAPPFQHAVLVLVLLGWYHIPCFIVVRSPIPSPVVHAAWPPHAVFVIIMLVAPPPLTNMQCWFLVLLEWYHPPPYGACWWVRHAGFVLRAGSQSPHHPPCGPCWLATTCRVLPTCSFGPGSPGMVSSPFPPCGSCWWVQVWCPLMPSTHAGFVLLSPPNMAHQRPLAKIDHPFPTHGGC